MSIDNCFLAGASNGAQLAGLAHRTGELGEVELAVGICQLKVQAVRWMRFLCAKASGEPTAAVMRSMASAALFSSM